MADLQAAIGRQDQEIDTASPNVLAANALAASVRAKRLACGFGSYSF
jgi:hypothetical protein